MSDPTFSASVLVQRSPEDLYDLVSDVTRTGQWSPVCTACWWDDHAGPRAGAWFTGRNQTPARTWDTRSLVTVAERGREFTFVVGGSWVSWSYTFAPAADGGTLLTETWTFLPEGIASFHARHGEKAQEQIDDRTRAAREGITVSLAAIKVLAEA